MNFNGIKYSAEIYTSEKLKILLIKIETFFAILTKLGFLIGF